MNQRPKQVDVAKLAGVSRTTVSFVLNKRFDERILISDSTRQKVFAAAQQLGYEPNDIARSLRWGNTKTIGFLIPALHNPHYWDILEGVEEEITAHGYHLSLVVANLNPERELNCLLSLSQQRLDGAILIPTFLHTLIETRSYLLKKHMPVVFTHPVDEVDWVFPDFRKSDEQMMDYLLSLGHQRIGLIDAGARSDISHIRQNIYLQKISSVGIPPEENYISRCGYQLGDEYNSAIKMLDLPQPPTAIWVINDSTAMGVIKAVHDRGLRIPEDISLAGYDDSMGENISPPLTTVHIPARQLGRRAVEILFRRIEFPDAEPIQEMISNRLVIRQSTCPPKIQP